MARTTRQRHVPHSRERGIYWSQRADGKRALRGSLLRRPGPARRPTRLSGTRFHVEALARAGRDSGRQGRDAERPSSISLAFAEAVEGPA